MGQTDASKPSKLRGVRCRTRRDIPGPAGRLDKHHTSAARLAPADGPTKRIRRELHPPAPNVKASHHGHDVLAKLLVRRLAIDNVLDREGRIRIPVGLG